MSRMFRPQDADRDANFAPGLVRHAKDGDLGDRRVGQDLLLDLARVHVRAAGDVHVGGAAGDVEEALLIHVPEIAGAEPAIPERFRVGVGIVVVPGEHRRAADADLPRLARAPARARHRPGSRPASRYAHSRRCRPSRPGRPPVSWSAGGNTVMLPVTSPSPKYCTSTFPSFFSACFWSSRYIGAPA